MFIIDPYRFGSGGPPDPSIYNPAAWYDADDLSTLFQDSAGTTPVASDGDPVGLWRDKSGNARHFSQTTSAQRPLWRTSGGYSWVEFDGTDDWLVGSTSMLAFGTVNLFVGMRTVAGGVDFGTVISQPHAATHSNPFYRHALQTRNSGGVTIGFIVNGSRADTTGAPAGSDVIVSMGYSSMWYDAGSQQRYNLMRINKSVALSGIAGSQTITYPNATVSTMGAQVNGAGDRFKGRIYSAILFDAAVASQAWVTAIENYIDGKMP